jgi:hypothetical protein
MYRISPYHMPKPKVKEEYHTSVPQCMCASGSGISILKPATYGRAALLVPKSEMKEEEDDMASLLRQRCVVASSDDSDNTLAPAFMSSLNDHNVWEGNIEDMITLPIRDNGMPLVDITRNDDDAGSSG